MTIEGIPDGWELVRIGKPLVNEYYIDVTGMIYKALDTTPTVLHWYMPIIRKIEKPKKFRPFANGDEFLSHPLHDGWINVGTVGFTKVCKFTDKNFWVHGEVVRCRWEEGFEFIKFRDGTPFGIEVTE